MHTYTTIRLSSYVQTAFSGKPSIRKLSFGFAHTGDAYALDDAGVGGFEGSDNVQCAVFYASGCALYRDLFLDLASLGAPPTPPPPPILPLIDQRLLPPTRIFFAGGPSGNMASSSTGNMGGDALTPESAPYRSRARMRRELQDAEYDDTSEIIDASDDPVVLDACTGGTEAVPTLCETQGYENSWITFDLGKTAALYAVSIGLYPHPVSPPSPPGAQPLQPPSTPPGSPPLPPTLPPPPGDTTTPTSEGCSLSDLISLSTCWHNLIKRTYNGICEDGGPGSTSNLCAWGTDYGDCPYRCHPGGDYHALPSEYLVQERGQNDPQCAPSTIRDDASGRAVIEESHVDPPGTPRVDMTTSANCQSNNHCNSGCGCVSRWQIPNTAAGELLASASKIRYRAIFSGRGACYNVLGYHRWGATGGWASNMAEASDFTIERSPTGSHANDFAEYYTHVTYNDNNEPQNNVWHQFSNCGAPGCDKRFWACADTATTPDHTSVYVNEHKRVDSSQPFDLATSNGVCGGYGSWRYEALEVYVLPYERHASVDCKAQQSTNLGTGELFAATLEECARACVSYEGADGTCNGFAYLVDSAFAYLPGDDEPRCSIKQLDSPYIDDVPNQCTADARVDMYIYNGPPLPPPPPPPPAGRRLQEQAEKTGENERRLQAPGGMHKVLDGCWSGALGPSYPHHNNHAVWKHFYSRAETLSVVPMRTCDSPLPVHPPGTHPDAASGGVPRTFGCEQAHDQWPGAAPTTDHTQTIYHSGVDDSVTYCDDKTKGPNGENWAAYYFGEAVDLALVEVINRGESAGGRLSEHEVWYCTNGATAEADCDWVRCSSYNGATTDAQVIEHACEAPGATAFKLVKPCVANRLENNILNVQEAKAFRHLRPDELRSPFSLTQHASTNCHVDGTVPDTHQGLMFPGPVSFNVMVDDDPKSCAHACMSIPGCNGFGLGVASGNAHFRRCYPFVLDTPFDPNSCGTDVAIDTYEMARQDADEAVCVPDDGALAAACVLFGGGGGVFAFGGVVSRTIGSPSSPYSPKSIPPLAHRSSFARAAARSASRRVRRARSVRVAHGGEGEFQLLDPRADTRGGPPHGRSLGSRLGRSRALLAHGSLCLGDHSLHLSEGLLALRQALLELNLDGLGGCVCELRLPEVGVRLSRLSLQLGDPPKKLRSLTRILSARCGVSFHRRSLRGLRGRLALGPFALQRGAPRVCTRQLSLELGGSDGG